MTLFERFCELRNNSEVDFAAISLEDGSISDPPYFCYPVDAEPIGFEGCILYCFLPAYGDMVFAANPESCADSYVYPLANSFEDFMRLVLACGSANPAEQVVWMNEKQFETHLTEETERQTDGQKAILKAIESEMLLEAMPNPFMYIKSLQQDFDASKIKYSREYYDLTGNVCEAQELYL